MFDTLSERLQSALADVRGRGHLTEDDVNKAMRQIRLALLEADVSLPVVRAFVARIKERARGAEVSAALNPAQQVVKIVNEELIGILGGFETFGLIGLFLGPTVMAVLLEVLREWTSHGHEDGSTTTRGRGGKKTIDG